MLFEGRALDRPLDHQRNELIFIGRNLDESQLRQAFRACFV
nr:GTP-binding protein [Thermosynechococcus vestitus]